MSEKIDWSFIILTSLVIAGVAYFIAVPFRLELAGKNPSTLRKFLNEQLNASAELENVNGEGPSWITDGYHANIRFTCKSHVAFKNGEGKLVEKPSFSIAESELFPELIRTNPSLLECREDEADRDTARLVHVKESDQYFFLKFHPSAF